MPTRVTPDQVAEAHWFKSTRSNNGTGCVEVAVNLDGVYLRDTKDAGQGPILHFTDDEWSAFVGGAKDGEFDK